MTTWPPWPPGSTFPLLLLPVLPIFRNAAPSTHLPRAQSLEPSGKEGESERKKRERGRKGGESWGWGGVTEKGRNAGSGRREGKRTGRTDGGRREEVGGRGQRKGPPATGSTGPKPVFLMFVSLCKSISSKQRFTSICLIQHQTTAGHSHKTKHLPNTAIFRTGSWAALELGPVFPKAT